MTDKYAVIAAEKADYPIVSMCGWLGVSRAGYYEWRSRPTSATAGRRGMLANHVVAIFEASRGTYGARRVAAALRARGKAVGVRQVVVSNAVALNPPIRTRAAARVEIAGPDSTGVDEGDKVDLYGQAGLRHYWVLRWHDRLLSVYTHDGTSLHLTERMSADRAVALPEPFPVVFRIEDLLLP